VCVALGEDPEHSFFGTGFVNGWNASRTFPDMPMFLVEGSSTFVAKITYDAKKMAVVYDQVLDDTQVGFRRFQGMRVVYDSSEKMYVVSHTTSFDDTGVFPPQMGMTALNTNGTVRWARRFDAGTVGGYNGFSSHPYALALDSAGGGYVIGGHVVFDDPAIHNIERCQGRMIRVDSTGHVTWDTRWVSAQKDTNIECYGVQGTLDGGFIMTCGTGVEPELHPADPQYLKTWMVLAMRVDSRGKKLWMHNFTTNADLQNNAGEYIVATREGEYAIFVDSQTWGPASTGGNFGLMKLTKDF